MIVRGFEGTGKERDGERERARGRGGREGKGGRGKKQCYKKKGEV